MAGAAAFAGSRAEAPDGPPVIATARQLEGDLLPKVQARTGARLAAAYCVRGAYYDGDQAPCRVTVVDGRTYWFGVTVTRDQATTELTICLLGRDGRCLR